MSQRMMVPGIDKAKLIHSPITKLNKSNGRNSEHIYKTESLPDIAKEEEVPKEEIPKYYPIKTKPVDEMFSLIPPSSNRKLESEIIKLNSQRKSAEFGNSKEKNPLMTPSLNRNFYSNKIKLPSLTNTKVNQTNLITHDIIHSYYFPKPLQTYKKGKELRQIDYEGLLKKDINNVFGNKLGFKGNKLSTVRLKKIQEKLEIPKSLANVPHEEITEVKFKVKQNYVIENESNNKKSKELFNNDIKSNNDIINELLQDDDTNFETGKKSLDNINKPNVSYN